MKPERSGGLWARIAAYDTVDIALWTLTATVAGLVFVAAYVIAAPETQRFDGLSYLVPAQIIDSENTVPVARDLAPPSIGNGDAVPVRLTRIIDCTDHKCPRNLLPVAITTRWQLLNDDGLSIQVTRFTVLDKFETSLVEGIDYVRDAAGIYTSQLNPIGQPPELTEWIEASDAPSSTWRLEGEVTPLIGDADPVPWQTAPFLLDHSGPSR